jgi:hypothetical protein
MSCRLSESAARALENAGKGHSSISGGPSALAESSRAQESSRPAGASNAFRTGLSEQHLRQSEGEFSSFLDGIDSLSSDP